MSIPNNNTAARHAALHFGLSWMRPPPIPDGNIGIDDRVHGVGLYTNIAPQSIQAASAVPGGQGVVEIPNTNPHLNVVGV